MLQPTRNGSCDNYQVWSLIQFSCVGVLLTRIGVTKGAFHISTSEVCGRCFCEFPVTYAPSAAHLIIMIFYQKHKLIEVVAKPGGLDGCLFIDVSLNLGLAHV